MKKHTQYRFAALGDGANDVAMIRSAHIGIGKDESFCSFESHILTRFNHKIRPS